jgi:flagellar motor switch protein FliM
MSSDTDAALAAAWGAELEDDSADGAAETIKVAPARVLNQAEIDSLLGFGDGPDGAETTSGMQRIISSGLVSYERLPMLEIVFDRLVRIMSTSLRNFTSDNVEVSIDNIVSLRFGDYLNSIPLPAMLAVFKAEEWDNYGLMVIDSAMIYSIAGRPARHRGHAHRRPAVYHDRAQPGRAPDPCRAGRSFRQLRSALPGDVPLRAAGG